MNECFIGNAPGFISGSGQNPATAASGFKFNLGLNFGAIDPREKEK
jgi:hypothetical protein